MKKRIIALALCLALVGIMAGCSQTAPAQSAPASSAAPAASAVSPASSAAPAASSETPKEIDWPKRTITVQTVTAGGDQDFLSRWLAVRIKKDMGANVVVVNNDNSVIASRNVLGNDPDGYTVMLGKSSTCIEKVNGAFEGFDFDSFEYLGTLTENPAQCIAVKPKLGVKTLPELIEYSKQHPGELRITDNIGSNTQVTVKLLEDLGAQFTSVDVGGSSAKMTAFLGDHCEVLVTLYASMEEYVKAGECVVLATISDERNPLFPDVPTAKEQGIDLSYGTSLYAALKKGTDPAIVEKFSSYLENLVKNDAEFEKAVREAQQLTPVWRSGPDTLQYLNDTVENLYDIGFATR